jgi:lipopolysaccharide export system permease protein
MRLLDRYLLRELIIPFGYCLVGFSIFWISFDLSSNLSNFQRHHLQAWDVLEYYLAKLPELYVVILPVTLLLALLYTLTGHARHQELIAIRAAGVSLLRISMPYFGMGLVIGLSLFSLNEFLVPQSTETTENILSRYETNQTQSASGDWVFNFGFTNARERRTWVIQAYNRSTGAMRSPHVVWVLADGTRQEFYAEHGAWINGHWIFTNVQEFVYPPTAGTMLSPVRSDSRVMSELTETPEEIRVQIKIGRIKSLRQARQAQLSIRELLLYKRLHPEDSDKDTLLYGRLAAPWTCMVIVLIALPFGVATGRRNVFVGVASSILICFAYFVCQQLALALGYGGRLPAWLAGWLPNLLFAALAILFTWRVR